MYNIRSGRIYYSYVALYYGSQMSDYFFYQKDKHTIAVERSEVDKAAQLAAEGYKKQFEEISASNERNALARFADIRKNNQIDRHNFLAGAAAMPLIGLLTAAAISLFRKKK